MKGLSLLFDQEYHPIPSAPKISPSPRTGAAPHNRDAAGHSFLTGRQFDSGGRDGSGQASRSGIFGTISASIADIIGADESWNGSGLPGKALPMKRVLEGSREMSAAMAERRAEFSGIDRGGRNSEGQQQGNRRGPSHRGP